MMPKGRILVIDEDPSTLALLSSQLSGDGYDVSSASGGMACMAQVCRDDPDLVVLALGLPACDGYLTLERLRDNPHWTHLPIVVFSASTQAEARARAMRVGATAFFEKTQGWEELLETILRLVERKT